jgi:hypothetical protein
MHREESLSNSASVFAMVNVLSFGKGFDGRMSIKASEQFLRELDRRIT